MVTNGAEIRQTRLEDDHLAACNRRCVPWTIDSCSLSPVETDISGRAKTLVQRTTFTLLAGALF